MPQKDLKADNHPYSSCSLPQANEMVDLAMGFVLMRPTKEEVAAEIQEYKVWHVRFHVYMIICQGQGKAAACDGRRAWGRNPEVRGAGGLERGAGMTTAIWLQINRKHRLMDIARHVADGVLKDCVDELIAEVGRQYTCAAQLAVHSRLFICLSRCLCSKYGAACGHRCLARWSICTTCRMPSPLTSWCVLWLHGCACACTSGILVLAGTSMSCRSLGCKFQLTDMCVPEILGIRSKIA